MCVDQIPPSYAEMLNEWSDATGGDILDKWGWEELREELLREELNEVIDAMRHYVDTGEAEWLAKELADLVYICFGTAQRPRIDLDKAFRIVHASNMTKIGPDGYKTRADGKILKPSSYTEPDMTPSIVAASA